MSKRFRLLAISLTLAVILIATVAGVAFAAGGPNPDPGTCPNPDCPNADCPDPDCPCDGDGLKYQHGHGPHYQDGHGPQYQNRFGQD